MKELYRKGVASHPDPESCAAYREAWGEALTGERVGEVLSLEILFVWGADDVTALEGNREPVATCETGDHPTGSETLARAETHRTGTGRSRDWPWQMAPRSALGTRKGHASR